ncbi:thioredoxin reductase [Actinoalloteichus hymeniacidonis]|uniref:Thioredoxin reductase n=2 Tax=Actinoalloteichus hymeniacidonis TaxID=340345 RepID=A0AAC9MZ66_9PSEU|nr:thioredoxin reductase [Actinoalloteichus hymeniacidonis]
MQGAYDVVVIGGGAAGLAGASTLARARRSVLVVDAGEPRNAPAAGVHNYLGREGTAPGELLAAGRAEVVGYGGEVITGEAVAAEAVGDGVGEQRFRITLSDGEVVSARRLVLATGLVDELPEVAGLAQRWGRDVVHCPYCHGWEVRDQAIGVLATSPMAAHQALLFRQWSADVTLFQHVSPAFDEEQRERFAARGIRLVDGEVVAVECRDDQLSGVRLRSGEVVARQVLAVAPRFMARVDVAGALGVEPVEQRVDGHLMGRYLPVDAVGATSVPGVWAVGDAVDLKARVISSAAAGANAAAAVNLDLVEEDTARAVLRHRERSVGGSGSADG